MKEGFVPEDRALSSLLDLVACPCCHGALEARAADGVSASGPGKRLHCVSCHESYELINGIPQLFPPGWTKSDRFLDPHWHNWEEKQQSGLQAYSQPEYHEGQEGYPDAFREFGRWSGTVLDVGCGVSPSLPLYMRDEQDVQYVGCDPLCPGDPRQYPFVAGLAEFLPFRSATFDQCLFATSLDHFIDPLPCLREALRVLRPGGEVVIWSDVHDSEIKRDLIVGGRLELAKNLLRERRYGEILQRALTSPTRIISSIKTYLRARGDHLGEDQYHFSRFTRDSLKQLLEGAGFRAEETALHRDHYFIRARAVTERAG